MGDICSFKQKTTDCSRGLIAHLVDSMLSLFLLYPSYLPHVKKKIPVLRVCICFVEWYISSVLIIFGWGWRFTSILHGRCWFRSGSAAYGFDSRHAIIMLGLLILTQAVQRMASSEEEKPMRHVMHQGQVFVLALLEFLLAALANIVCGMVATLT